MFSRFICMLFTLYIFLVFVKNVLERIFKDFVNKRGLEKGKSLFSYNG